MIGDEMNRLKTETVPNVFSAEISEDGLLKDLYSWTEGMKTALSTFGRCSEKSTIKIYLNWL